MAYREKRLDRDLTVDRTKVWEIDDLQLKWPEETIRVGGAYTFKIENFDQLNSYDINFSKGTCTRIGNNITYNAAPDWYGPVRLTIKVRAPDLDSFVIFKDGTVYTDKGVIDKAAFNGEQFSFLNRELNYQEELAKNRVAAIPSPVPSRKKSGSIELGDFSVEDVFGPRGSKKLKKGEEKNGDIADYHLPSERNKKDDEQKFLYDVENGKFITVPRNSNVNESDGDVFKGYRKPGDVGGSLTVTQGESIMERIFTFDFEVKLWNLEAILPEDIVAMCMNTLSFTPALRGNPLGHVFFWEQISGDQGSLTWVSQPTDLHLVINIGELKVDRVFRFWISRGTEYERYYNLVVYGTPVDKTLTGFGTHGQGFCGNHLNNVTQEVIPILLDQNLLYHKDMRINVIKNY